MTTRGGAGREPDEYGTWDTTPIRIPPRSRLHHLAPVGVGTGAVESLTSYFTRLAGSHAVSLHPLAVKVVAPLLDPERVWWTGTTTHMFFSAAARTMSGIGEIAETWIRALAMLTLRDDLRSLTLLPWSGVVSARGLLRQGAAWCPTCYEEWSTAGAIIYRPLLWHLAVITACPGHGRALSTRCPHPGCGAAQKLRSTATRPGYCAACAGWLGSAEPPGPEHALDDATRAWQSWVHEAIAAMLADAATRPRPFGGEDLTAALVACTAAVGSNNNLARVTGLGHTLLTGWRLGHRLPSIPALLQFCHRLGTTPLRLLTEQPPTLRPLPPGEATVSGRRADKAPLDWGRIRAALATQVREPDAPPSSLKEMARRLDCSAASLTRVIPEDAAIIVARARAHREQRSREASQGRVAEVRRVTLERHAADLGTTATEVKAALANPTMWWTPDAEDARRAALAEVGMANEEAVPAPARSRASDQRPAAPSWLTLTEEERRALTAALAGGATAPREQRLRAILLLGGGRRPNAAARALGVSQGAVYAWAKAWRTHGLAGLDDVPGGQAPTFDASTSQPLVERLAASPTAYGHHRTVWSAPMLHAEMTKLGHTVSRATVQRAAEQLGWHPQRTVPVPPATPLLALSTAEEGLLRRALAAEGHEPYRRRIRAILLLAQGDATRTVAATAGVSGGSILIWAKAWRAGGLPGLLGRPGVAGNPVLDAAAKRLLEERLSGTPGAYGHAAPAWTLALLQVELAEAGCVVSQGTVWCALKHLGWRCARPGYVKVPLWGADPADRNDDGETGGGYDDG